MRPGPSPRSSLSSSAGRKTANSGASRAAFAGLAGLGMCVAASLSSAACGSTATEPTPPALDGAADGAPDVLPTGDAAAPDAADATDATDAADASPDAPVAPVHYCAGLVPKPKFCDDFGDGDLTNDWTQFAAQPGSVFELDTTTSTSAPASFHVVAMAEMAAAANNVLLRTTMFGAVNHGKLAFSTLLPAVTFTQGAVAIAKFHITLDDSYTLFLRGPDAAGNVATLEENIAGTITEHPLSVLPPIGVWTRVMIDLDVAGGKASVSFGAQKALDAVAITPTAGSEATVRIGAIIDGPSDKVEAHFDDVVVDF